MNVSLEKKKQLCYTKRDYPIYFTTINPAGKESGQTKERDK